MDYNNDLDYKFVTTKTINSDGEEWTDNQWISPTWHCYLVSTPI